MKIVVLTGAGISAESGLPTFRATDGLWENHRVEDVATPEAFERDYELVQKFYNLRRAKLKEVKPNAAHFALAQLEQKFGDDFLLVTQNIDDLHERAGSKNLIHMHGEVLKIRHCQSGDVKECREDVEGNEWRPHIVWFGEMPFEMDRIYDSLRECDKFISIGTSGKVYPAAQFVVEAKRHGAETIEINVEPSDGHHYFDRKIYGKASEKLPELVAEI